MKEQSLEIWDTEMYLWLGKHRRGLGENNKFIVNIILQWAELRWLGYLKGISQASSSKEAYRYKNRKIKRLFDKEQDSKSEGG